VPPVLYRQRPTAWRARMITIRALNVRSLCFQGDALIDWVAGARAFSLDGVDHGRRINLAYRFVDLRLRPARHEASRASRTATARSTRHPRRSRIRRAQPVSCAGTRHAKKAADSVPANRSPIASLARGRVAAVVFDCEDARTRGESQPPIRNSPNGKSRSRYDDVA
jgi:hypothetical protein